ncbi:hypothetical protein DID88_002997 [Monilinia fructigena]|uniref:Uncharacterized protein n=1 Tax=Monilinia fructigena TaxID=38457 RepID=A0A395IEV0_9HELO|nr:hypothetical protein DID88_002997 [Monilinia fructigena]
MLAIRPPSKQLPSKSTKKYAPNLMPCRINHTAPIKFDKRYWGPRVTRNDRGKEELVAYFRGRRLIGRKVKVPVGWRGVVLRVGEEIMPGASSAERRRGEDADMDADEDEDEMEEKEVETKITDEEGAFDDLTVWGHECLVDASADMFVRGIEEWMDWAGVIHGCEDETDKDEKSI